MSVVDGLCSADVAPRDLSGKTIESEAQRLADPAERQASPEFPERFILVSTQWPLRGASTNFPFYEPEFEANFPCVLCDSTMETFLVADRAPLATGCDMSESMPFCRPCHVRVDWEDAKRVRIVPGEDAARIEPELRVGALGSEPSGVIPREPRERPSEA